MTTTTNGHPIYDEGDLLTIECLIMESEKRKKDRLTGKQTVKILYDRFVAMHGDTDTDEWSVLTQTLFIHLQRAMKHKGGEWVAPRPAPYLCEIFESVINYTFPENEPPYKRR